MKAHGAEAVNPEIPDDLDTSDDLLIAQVEQWIKTFVFVLLLFKRKSPLRCFNANSILNMTMLWGKRRIKSMAARRWWFSCNIAFFLLFHFRFASATQSTGCCQKSLTGTLRMRSWRILEKRWWKGTGTGKGCGDLLSLILVCYQVRNQGKGDWADATLRLQEDRGQAGYQAWQGDHPAGECQEVQDRGIIFFAINNFCLESWNSLLESTLAMAVVLTCRSQTRCIFVILQIATILGGEQAYIASGVLTWIQCKSGKQYLWNKLLVSALPVATKHPELSRDLSWKEYS